MRILAALLIVAAICFFVALIGKKGKNVEWDGGCSNCPNKSCKNCHSKK